MDKYEALTAALKERNADPFDYGDVIRWIAGGRYTYAAVKTPVGWFTTSANSFVPKTIDYSELVELLAEGTDVEVATDWRKI